MNIKISAAFILLEYFTQYLSRTASNILFEELVVNTATKLI